MASDPVITSGDFIPAPDKAHGPHPPGTFTIGLVVKRIDVSQVDDERAVTAPQDVAARITVVVLKEVLGERLFWVEFSPHLVCQLNRRRPSASEINRCADIGEAMETAGNCDLPQPKL